jgi:hypothetical protein
MTKRTRRKIDAGLKAKIALDARLGRQARRSADREKPPVGAPLVDRTGALRQNLARPMQQANYPGSDEPGQFAGPLPSGLRRFLAPRLGEDLALCAVELWPSDAKHRLRQRLLLYAVFR